MKRIGIGLSDFKELIEEDFYYFDKTKFIDEIVKDGAKVKLFTRPRDVYKRQELLFLTQQKVKKKEWEEYFKCMLTREKKLIKYIVEI